MAGRTRIRARLALTAVTGLALTVSGLAVGAPPTSAAPACASVDPGGGSWPSYGHDLSNSRTQDQESSIGAANVASLKAHWSFSTAAGGGGTVQTTPAVADGCVFFGTSSGRMLALNADTGAVVWSVQLVSPSTPAGLGGLLVGAPAVDSAAHRVIVAVDQTGGPFVVSLDELTGATQWTSLPVDSVTDGPWGAVSGDNAGPTVANGKVFLGFYGSEFTADARGGFVILDEATGGRLAHTYIIPDADYALGYRGASVWATAAIDPVGGYAYVGTGNPGGHPAPGADPSQFPQCVGTLPGQPCNAAIEHPNSDAILKIDFHSAPPLLGTIVGVYKGNPENYAGGLDRQPACANAGNVEAGVGGDGVNGWSVACLQLDLDFGASPNLIVGPGGLVVGELQKSGVYHAVDAATMNKSWTTPIGGPCAACNAASTASDANGIYGEGAPGGIMVSLGLTGAYRWGTPVGDGVHYESTSTANGVAYTVDNAGFLDAFDAGTGAPVLKHPLAGDVGQPVSDVSSAGVAIARHTVYAAEAGYVVAYGL